MARVEAEAIRRIPLFRDLTVSDLATLAEHARVRRFAAREVIVQQDVRTNALFVIERGRATVSIATPDGRNAILRELGPGEIIGEIALLDRGAHSATVTAATKTDTISIDGASFQALLARQPAIAVALLPVLAERLRRLTSWADDLAGLPLAKRLAKCLLGLAADHGQRVGPSRLWISQKVSQQDLGRRLGVTRESVNKHLRRFERAGAVAQEAGHIVVTDLRLLQSAASID